MEEINKNTELDNTDEKLHISAVICRLFDKNANEWINYTGATYTKLSGIYGYLSVDVMTVKFFWYNEDSQCVSCDDITDRFKIEYVFSNGI